MTTHIALLRGINVGRAKRIAMADLRAVVAGLGYENVRTLLNSGNVVFDADRAIGAPGAIAIREAVASRTGVVAEVVVITAEEIGVVVAEDPFASVVTDPSHYLVAFPGDAGGMEAISGLLGKAWDPDRFAIGSKAAYLWCAEGVLQSALLKEFGRRSGTSFTTRNWSTVLKLHAMSNRSDPA